MAFDYSGVAIDMTLKSSGDMSEPNQYKFVVASTTNDVDGCILVATRGSAATGVWQQNSTTSEYGKVIVLGVSKVAAGDSSAMENAINSGGRLVASSQGQAVPSTDTRLASVGVALQHLSTGSTGIIAALVIPGATSTA